TGTLSYEHLLNENSSFAFSVLYCDQSELWVSSGFLSRFAVSPEYRFYLSEDRPAPEGWYLNTILRYQHLKAEWSEYVFTGDPDIDYYNVLQEEKDTYGLGLGVGFQEVFKNKIALDMHIGTIFNTGEDRTVDPYTQSASSEFEPYVGYFFYSGVKVGFVLK
ncbi:MAG: DUF3575 domain-containing protein, partial [Flavobacteriales bacterium]|nr:DUF3575 domain-containing protein [Flavobacteriales bacterium]